MSAWCAEELGAVQLGDQRLDRRAVKVLEQLAAQPTQSIPTACGSNAEMQAAYRFFDNAKVSVEKILAPHQAATGQRMAGQAVVLFLHDTSELDYTSHEQMEGLGPLANDPCQGILCHTTLVVTPERVPLGVLETKFWVRDAQTPNQTDQRKQKPIEQKESFRWLESYRLAQRWARQLPGTRVISIADREGDIYETYAEATAALAPGPEDSPTPSADFIIRASQDRSLPEKTARYTHRKLWNRVAAAPVLGEIEFDVPAAPGRSARRVHQTVRSVRVHLNPPFRKGRPLPIVEINAVYCQEIDPPKGEKPITWLLLTSLPVESLAQAIQVVEWYLCRWQVEVLFKTLKSGCGIEELQFEKAHRLQRCLAFYMIAAWRIMYALMLGRAKADLNCESVFSAAEWKSVWQVVQQRTPPVHAPTLREFLKVLGRLGGHMNRKSDGKLGVKRMWTAMQRMRDLAVAWEAFEKNV
jgi:hypothetical protein